MKILEGEYRSVMSFLPGPKLVFGMDSYKTLADETKKLNQNKESCRVLLITDDGVFKSGIVDILKNHLTENKVDVEIFHNLSAEPTLETVEEAVAFSNIKNFDVLLGVGGGSAMDTAKVISVAKTHGGKIEKYLGGFKFTNGRCPLILIPTTAGTGSEVTGDAVFSVKAQKRWISDPLLVADIALIDPMLTVTMPPRITASTGLDVLCHAIEGIMTTYSNSIMEMYAGKAVELTMLNLERAYICGKDIEARYNMMIAAMMAGIVNLNAPATYPHSIGYTVANRFKVPHGLSCAIGLPYMMQYNLPKCETQFAKMTEMIYPDFEGTKKEKAQYLVDRIFEIVKTVNAPSTLKEVGVTEDMLDMLAEECFVKFPRSYNICDINQDGVKKLYQQICNGSR